MQGKPSLPSLPLARVHYLLPLAAERRHGRVSETGERLCHPRNIVDDTHLGSGQPCATHVVFVRRVGLYLAVVSQISALGLGTGKPPLKGIRLRQQQGRVLHCHDCGKHKARYASNECKVSY